MSRDTQVPLSSSPKKRRRERGRPSLAEASGLYDHLLDVASAAFVELGYGGTSIAAIATRSEITKKTFYNHFSDKEAVFEAVCKRNLARFADGMLGEIEQLGLIQTLTLVGNRLLALWTLPVEGTVRLIYAEGVRFPQLAAILNTTSRAAEHYVSEVLSRFSRPGTDVHRAARTYVHMIYMAPQAWILLRPAESYAPKQRKKDLNVAINLFANSWQDVF